LLSLTITFARKCDEDTPIGTTPPVETDPCEPPDGEIIVATPPNPED
jgi:hypothetical protein